LCRGTDLRAETMAEVGAEESGQSVDEVPALLVDDIGAVPPHDDRDGSVVERAEIGEVQQHAIAGTGLQLRAFDLSFGSHRGHILNPERPFRIREGYQPE